MSKPQGYKKYLASPTILQRARLEILPAHFDWHEARIWFWPTTLLTIVIVLYLAQSAFTTTSELEMSRLLRERDLVLRRNAQLTTEIAEAEKPGRIRERAAAMGLVDAAHYVVLPVTIHAPERTPVTPSKADMPESWDGWVDEFARWSRQANKQLERLP